MHRNDDSLKSVAFWMSCYIYISLSFWWIRSTLQRGWFDPWLNCEHRNRFGVQCSGHGNFSIANRILDNFLWCCLCFNFDANSVRHRQMENDRAPLSPHIHFVCDKWHIYQLGTLCLCQQHTIWIYCCQQLLSRSYVDFEWNSTQIIFANWIEMCTDSVLRKLYVFFFLFVASYFISFFLFSSLVCHFNVTSTHLLVFNASAEQIKQTPEMFVACFGLFLYNFHSFLSNFIWIHFYSVKCIWFIQMCRLQFA